MPRSAAIICTRNRHDALSNTLSSIAKQDFSPLPVIVVDGSDHAIWEQNKKTLSQFSAPPLIHHRYEGPPSAAKQRNLGLQLLPDSAETVFFFDDDITLRPNCLHHLATALQSSSNLCGVSAHEAFLENHSKMPSSYRSRFWRYLFLLDSRRAGRVLPSGRISPYFFFPSHDQLIPIEWVSTCCCAYDRSVFDRFRFDESLWGAMLEDLDLSYRISKDGALAVVPWAKFVHHRSPINRQTKRQSARDRTIQRYWFVEKNLEHPLRKPAFWWATVGQILATLASPKTQKWKVLRGLLTGVRAVATRSHPLLQKKRARSLTYDAPEAAPKNHS